MTESFLLLVAILMLAIDWRQTISIFRDPTKIEFNKVINKLYGKHGEPGVHAWFALWLVLGLVAAYLTFGTPWFYILSTIGTMTEGYYVVNNFKAKIFPDFKKF